MLNAEKTKLIEWLKRKTSMEGKSSRQWKEAGNQPMSDYRAGASNAFLEVIDYIERHLQ